VGLAILVTAFSVRAQFRRPDAPVDPAVELGSHTPVPVHVMSLLRRACFDCHSQETRWPWYSRLPLVSFLLERDVNAGRVLLNFSQWQLYNSYERAELLDKVCEMARTGVMPLRPYLMLHREARLSQADIALLCEWTSTESTRLVQGGS
jgi:hypothetical protein